mmetsp:Transcript_24095/g.41264  ORF Transcript_24095/g.41264 Transcript_24095/m.41264 type:complete len:89 (-) Transcript_24095:102-368(-)
MLTNKSIDPRELESEHSISMPTSTDVEEQLFEFISEKDEVVQSKIIIEDHSFSGIESVIGQLNSPLQMFVLALLSAIFVFSYNLHYFI